jgi:hypothetical protein
LPTYINQIDVKNGTQNATKIKEAELNEKWQLKCFNV